MESLRKSKTIQWIVLAEPLEIKKGSDFRIPLIRNSIQPLLVLETKYNRLCLERRNDKRNPEVATQPLFFGKIEDVAYEKSTLLDLSNFSLLR